jgi:hypothetical protein
VGQKILRHCVENILHVPNFNCNLLSLGHLNAVRVKFEGEKGKVVLKNANGRVVGLRQKKRGMYLLDAVGEKVDDAVANAAVECCSWEEWHKRYGHLAYSGLETLKWKNMVEGLDIEGNQQPKGICNACVKAKLAHRPFPKESTTKTEKPGELTVTDVWGPARVESLAKSKYYVSFTDHHTR